VENKINIVYILGLGAMGGLYAAKLHDLNPDLVKIIADRNRISALQKHGITVNGKVYHFDYAESGEPTLQPADLIIIAVKHPQLQQAIRDIKAFIQPETIIISLLNGISSEEEIGAEVGAQHLLYAYGVGMDAVRQGHEITFDNPGKLVFGERNNEISWRVQLVKALFEAAKIPYQIPENIIAAQWFKFMINTGINQVSAVLKANYGVLQQNKYAQELMLDAAKEVMAVSQKMNINLSQKDLDEMLRILNTLGPTGKTSMLQDIEAGRKTEVAIFAGEVIKLGQKHHVPTPVNKALFNLIHALETS